MDDFGASEASTLLHDAVVDQFRFDAARARLEVIIWKRLENQQLLRWQLIISGIRNAKCIQQAQAAADAVLTKAKRHNLGFRVDEFGCEKQPATQQGDVLIVNLSIDHLVPIRVECAKCNLQRLEH